MGAAVEVLTMKKKQVSSLRHHIHICELVTCYAIHLNAWPDSLSQVNRDR